MNEFNQTLFLQLCAKADSPQIVTQLALWLAQYPIYVLSLVLMLMWRLSCTRKAALLALCSCGLALGLSFLLGQLWPHARPFVAGLGPALLEHAATPSFPSNHACIFASIGAAFALAGWRWIGGVVLTLGVLVGMARIYVGVHFHLDIAGGFMVGCLAAFCLHRCYQQQVLQDKAI